MASVTPIVPGAEASLGVEAKPAPDLLSATAPTPYATTPAPVPTWPVEQGAASAATPGKRKVDGTFCRPKGRAPKGKEWDAKVGEWSEHVEGADGESSTKKQKTESGRQCVDACTGLEVRATKTTKFPSKLGDLVGRDIVKLFKNVVSEDLEWYVGTIGKLIEKEDLATWRLPEPKKGSQTWVQVQWTGDPKKRVTHQLLDPTTFPFCLEDAPIAYDTSLHDKWAILLDPTTFAYTSKGSEKMLRQGIWKLIDKADDENVLPTEPPVMVPPVSSVTI